MIQDTPKKVIDLNKDELGRVPFSKESLFERSRLSLEARKEKEKLDKENREERIDFGNPRINALVYGTQPLTAAEIQEIKERARLEELNLNAEAKISRIRGGHIR